MSDIEKYFVHIADQPLVLEYETETDALKDVRKYVDEGTPLGDILIIRGFALKPEVGFANA